MPLSEQDRIDITDLIHLHGHHVDTGRLDRAAELFTPDVAYDVGDLGLGTLQGVEAITRASLAMGDRNPVGHHVTNVVISEIDDGSARVRSKGIGITAAGTAGSVAYDDVVVRLADGWRISRRTVTARRAPLGGSAEGPREVLERWRSAAIDRSADGMRRVYAADAVHEFPFTPPGVPSRLEGRDTIVDWISAGWEAHGLRYEHYRTLAVHRTDDPDTIVVEQEALGTSTLTGAFTLPNVVVLTARDGRIARLRDYVDTQAAAAATG
ncbi:nuclear transport factor 2 family protein [Pseudonocardia zijingensis]|jgi:ketosteroid isomerase-like protein|uniref:SnoaL-like domain-containing protein n=1 Tax=Pseudonocardia zijingensis TaxID=153376 RepID=A0ABP3YMQ4_9PSEU